MLAANPALWLAARHSGARVFLWGMTAVAVIGGLICFFAPEVTYLLVVFAIINFLLKLRLAAQACHCFAEARRNNALEMLLATPLTVNEIIQGQILALQRTFLAPVIAIICVEAVAIFGKTAIDTGANGAFAMILCSMYFVLFLLDIVAVTWAGMWFGLTAKNETQAITRTILRVLILPYASFIFCWFGMVLFIGIPIFWIGWCSSKLRTEFRAIAAQRYAPPQASAAGTQNQPAPPVMSYPTQ
jgi:hypothetical protein